MNEVDPETNMPKVWKLRHGDDFTCSVKGMAQNIYWKKRTTPGKTVSVFPRTDPDGRDVLIFQFKDES